MSKEVIDLKERAKQRAEHVEVGQQVNSLETALHSFFSEEAPPSDVAMHALIRYASRIAVQSVLSHKAFVAACGKVYKDIAKELRGGA
jgi:hypothetical protein